MSNQRGSVAGGKDKRSKKAVGGEDTGEDGQSANPFTVEDDQGSAAGHSRKHKKSKRGEAAE